jgi:DNA-binding FadR family transcriptional regulator
VYRGIGISPRRPLAGSNLSDQIAWDLQSKIVSGELRPGDRLPTESELGDLYGVSRSVIRDSVRLLVARGLVSVRQRNGIVVTEPSAKAFGDMLVVLLMRSEIRVRDLLSARAALDIALAPLAAARGRDTDWEGMDRRLQAMTAALEKEDWRRMLREHLEFHLGLLHAVHTPALEIALRPMQHVILISSVPPTLSDRRLAGLEAHYPILKALRQGDGPAAQEALREHYRDRPGEDAGYQRFQETPLAQLGTMHELLLNGLDETA